MGPIRTTYSPRKPAGRSVRMSELSPQVRVDQPQEGGGEAPGNSGVEISIPQMLMQHIAGQFGGSMGGQDTQEYQFGDPPLPPHLLTKPLHISECQEK